MEVLWRNRWRWHTGYSADSAEWCPVEHYRDVMVCGTYQLDNKDGQEQPSTKQTRLGRIYLFVIDEDTPELTPIQTIDTSGILDQKWCHHTVKDCPVLAAVTSEGGLQFYRLVEDAGTLRLGLWFEHVIGPELLALSLDWSSNRTPSDEPRIIVSDSSGGVTVLKLVGDGVQKVGTWKSHGFEAWVAAFNYWNPNIFYSGGDDCLFKSYDLRVSEGSIAVNRNHGAGVTAIRSHVDVEHQLLTGSYDEKVRLWDARSLKCSVTETDVNGGVWRLKWHPYTPDVVLAACMYGGFRVLRTGDGVNAVCEYLEHDSIAYGADWKYDERPLAATCSFYDCSLHVSEVILSS